jgi:hypothetical protein
VPIVNTPGMGLLALSTHGPENRQEECWGFCTEELSCWCSGQSVLPGREGSSQCIAVSGPAATLHCRVRP